MFCTQFVKGESLSALERTHTASSFRRTIMPRWQEPDASLNEVIESLECASQDSLQGDQLAELVTRFEISGTGLRQSTLSRIPPGDRGLQTARRKILTELHIQKTTAEAANSAAKDNPPDNPFANINLVSAVTCLLYTSPSPRDS